MIERWPDVRQYVNSYELRGDNGDYTPNEWECLMIEDAIQGCIAAVIEACPPQSTPVKMKILNSDPV